MRDLNEIQCFVKAVELNSLTAAAKFLSLPKSSVSRKIQSLEIRLGMTLIRRTTRAINLTEAGKVFYNKSAKALKEIDIAEETLDVSRQEVMGLIKITVPVEFSTGPFNDFLRDFLNLFPRVNIELVTTERVVDIIGEGFDFAFRIGDLKDSSLIAKRMTTYEAQVYASPDYIKARGLPKTIADFEEHDCIAFSPANNLLNWNLRSSNSKKTFNPKGRLTANNLLTVKEAAVKGLGLALLPTYILKDELDKKLLRNVLPEWRTSAYSVHLVYASQKFLAPNMRAFINHASLNLKL